MQHWKFAALSTLVFVGSASLAMAKIDCTTATAQPDLNACAEEEATRADASLNEDYQAAMVRMQAVDADLPEDQRGAAEALRQAQRAWIITRDKTCEAYAYPMRGAQAEPMQLASCRREMSEKRGAELQALAEM